MPHCNFRLVAMPEINDGNPWIELREVCYDNEGVPICHCPPRTGGATIEQMLDLIRWHSLALAKPILNEASFVGNYADTGVIVIEESSDESLRT